MAISVVHTTVAFTTSVTIPSTTAGNTLVVCINGPSGSGTPSVSGVTLGGSSTGWASAKSQVGAGNGAFSAQWINENIAGSQTAIVVSGSNLDVTSGTGGIVIYEISGLLTSASLDKTGSDSGTGTSWTSLGTGSLSQPNEIVIGCANPFGSGTGPSSPWTNAGTGGAVICGYQIVSATTSLAYSGSTSSGEWSATIITLKGPGNVSVALGTATVAVAAYPLGVQTGPIALGTATIGVAAHPLVPSTFTNVNLGTATVSVAAQAPGVQAGPVSLGTATVNVAAHGFTPTVSVPLGTATVAVQAHALTPVVHKVVPLGTATVSVTAHPLTPTVTNPVLIASISNTGGTDQWGNNWVPGIVSYSTNLTPSAQVEIYDGTIAFNEPTAYPSGVPAVIEGGNNGLFIYSGSQNASTDVQAQMNLLSVDSSGTGNAEVVITDANLNMNGGSITSVNDIGTNEMTTGSLVLNGQTISVPQGSPPSISGAGSSYSQTTANTWVTAINYILAVLQDSGIVS